jgi:hypothetical protein
MVTNLLGSSQALDSSLNSIISEFLTLNDYPTIFQSCARNLRLLPHDGVSKTINNYNRMVAYSVADGADIAQHQALADTSTSYTPAEVAVQTWLPGSTMRRAADPDIRGRTSKILRNAIDLKIDQDGGLQLPNFVPVQGTANIVLGPGSYLAASVMLAIGNSRSNPEPPPKPWFTVDHPYKLATVAGRIIPLTDVPGGGSSAVYLPATSQRGLTVAAGATPSLSDRIMNEGWMALGQLFGIPIKATANIIPDASDDVSGASFSREALIYVEEVAPKMVPDDSDKSYRDAVELNCWCSYIWGVFRSSNWGVEIIGDATTPAA